MRLGNLDNKDNPIIITAHWVTATTWVTMDEVFKNQLAWNPATRKVWISDFSSLKYLQEVLKWDKNHPTLKIWMSEQETIKAVEELLDLSWWLPVQINWAVSHNWELLTEKWLIELIKWVLEWTSDQYRDKIAIESWKWGFDPSIINSIYASLVATKEAWLLWEQWLIDKSISVHLWSWYAWLHKVEFDWMTKGTLVWAENPKRWNMMWLKYLLAALPNMPAPIVANMLWTNGESTLDNEACASAWYAYKRAVMQILTWQTDIAIAWWCDNISDSFHALKAFWGMWALAKWYENMPWEALRPFNKALQDCSKWFVLWDWGWISTVERNSVAKARWATSQAEITWIWASTCSPLHIKWASLSSGTVEWQSISMNKALESAWISVEEFKEEWVIFAHWTWTQMWDSIESQSIHNVFWDWVQVTWVKWVLWHALWWSFWQSVSIWLSTFKSWIIPWTLNYSNDTKMDWIPDLDIIETNRKKEVKYILINAFWFGWHNVSMIIKNPKY